MLTHNTMITGIKAMPSTRQTAVTRALLSHTWKAKSAAGFSL